VLQQDRFGAYITCVICGYVSYPDSELESGPAVTVGSVANVEWGRRWQRVGRVRPPGAFGASGHRKRKASRDGKPGRRTWSVETPIEGG
jgi:hypothetical protein